MEDKEQGKRYSCTGWGDYDDLVKGLKEYEHTRYFVVGKEIGSKKGLRHNQFYVEFKSNVRFNTLKKIIVDSQCHIEDSRGTWIDNFNYCTKNKPREDWTQWGTPAKQGKRNDLKLIKESVKEQKSIRSMLDKDIIENQQQLRFAESLQKYYRTYKRHKPEVIWIWGPSDTGKTKGIWDSEPDLLDLNNDGQWFDGYDKQEAVLFDDFRCEMPYVQFLKLTDRYPCAVPIKGGFTNWNPKRIYITSNIPPEMAYLGENEEKTQHLRRITKVIHKTKFETYVTKGGTE